MPKLLDDFGEAFMLRMTSGELVDHFEAGVCPSHLKTYISDKIRQVLEGLKKPDREDITIPLEIRYKQDKRLHRAKAFNRGFNIRNAELTADIDRILSGLERKDIA